MGESKDKGNSLEEKVNPEEKRGRVQQPSSLLCSRKKGTEGREAEGEHKFNMKDSNCCKPRRKCRHPDREGLRKRGFRNASPQTLLWGFVLFLSFPSYHKASQTFSLWLSASVVPFLMSLLCADRQDGCSVARLSLSQCSSSCRVQSHASVCLPHWEVLQLALFGSQPHTLNQSAIAEMKYHDSPALVSVYDQAQ